MFSSGKSKEPNGSTGLLSPVYVDNNSVEQPQPVFGAMKTVSQNTEEGNVANFEQTKTPTVNEIEPEIQQTSQSFHGSFILGKENFGNDESLKNISTGHGDESIKNVQTGHSDESMENIPTGHGDENEGNGYKKIDEGEQEMSDSNISDSSNEDKKKERKKRKETKDEDHGYDKQGSVERSAG